MNEFKLKGTIYKVFSKKTTTNKYLANITLKITQEARTTYVTVSFWDEIAYQVIDHAPQGSMVEISGFLSNGSYKDAQGGTKYITNVTARNFKVLERAQREEYKRPAPNDDDIAF